jgi:O-Antigen ligase
VTEAAAALVRLRPEPRARRIGLIWGLLFLDALGSSGAPLVPIPHRITQLVTQGALALAVLLALTVNTRLRIRLNWFLGLYTLLAVTSLMMSVRLAGFGTAYRSFRLLAFLLVLWLLTPYWGRRDLLLLRCQMRLLSLAVVSVVVGLLIAPGHALPGGRLTGTIWPIPSTQVAHYAAQLAGLAVVLWLCHLASRRLALTLALPSLLVVVLTHTRTALTGMIVGLLVATASLFVSRRRVRRSLAITLVVIVVVVVPASPLLMSWLARGESGQQITNLTGRTNAWSLVLSSHRPATNVIFGSGLSNDSVNIASDPASNGLPIDSSWISIYQDQGIVGEIIVGAIMLLLLVAAFTRARGPTRALALFLIVYCLIAGISESGLGGASEYLLDLTVAASLLAAPSVTGADVSFGLRLPRARGDEPQALQVPRVA